jgi:hypothetical protein
MIGHPRRRGRSALASAASAHILPRQRRRVRSAACRSNGAGEPLGAYSAPRGESGHLPGSAGRPREPVSSPRRPTTDPWTLPSAHSHACPPRLARPRGSRSPPRAPRSPRSSPRAPRSPPRSPRSPPRAPRSFPPRRPALTSLRPPLERRARTGRPPASPTGQRICRNPPRQRRAGFAVRRRPARVTPQRGDGGGRTAQYRRGDLPHRLPRPRGGDGCGPRRAGSPGAPVDPLPSLTARGAAS